MNDLTPIPADIMAAQQEARDMLALTLDSTLAMARELGVPDATLKKMVMVLYAEGPHVLDGVEAEALIRRFQLEGA